MNYKELITAYETDVQFPEVSGMEHLDMLMTRSRIAQYASHLSDEERRRVLEADQLLLRQAKQFYQSIQDIADLASWRRDENVPVTHWWWYLDVIAQLPVYPEMLPQSTPPTLEWSQAGA
jgi:hypothetical protein